MRSITCVMCFVMAFASSACTEEGLEGETASSADAGTRGPSDTDVDVPVEPQSEPVSSAYASTYEALQVLLFDGQGCTTGGCHDASAVGGLDLTAEVSFSQLFDVPSVGSSLNRIEPGDRHRSYLYQKLLAARDPEAAQVSGAPMPIGSGPIPEELLEALRLWIYAGAPENGTVSGTAELLGATLPEVTPLTIVPLSAPDPSEGFQLELPPWKIPAYSEREVCFASYFDVRDQVPDAVKDENGDYAFVMAEELRQDPQSHHLILNLSKLSVDEIDDPAFGVWLCRGGAKGGQACDPLVSDACGDGHCATEPKDGFACIGYGPSGGGFQNHTPIGGAQKAQDFKSLPEGVYKPVPLHGILYWNSHAFNLTAHDHMMNGRLNFLYTDNPVHLVRGFLGMTGGDIFKPNTPPFERSEICSELTLPVGSRIIWLSSHTHQRGERFQIFHPDGELLYENTVYNDPLRKTFDPPLIFDSEDAAERTLTYCAVYNNGVGAEGEPDPETVTRYSRMPESVEIPGVPGACSPIACVTGQVGAPCDGPADDASCDTSPGAGDGWCDACAITGGESTENEMFLVLGDYYVVDE
ncbi:MAG: hypothetical protein ACPGU1_08250 [Myxococcota bacterium]